MSQIEIPGQTRLRALLAWHLGPDVSRSLDHLDPAESVLAAESVNQALPGAHIVDELGEILDSLLAPGTPTMGSNTQARYVDRAVKLGFQWVSGSQEAHVFLICFLNIAAEISGAKCIRMNIIRPSMKSINAHVHRFGFSTW